MNTMPTDKISNRLIVEVHYYTPWNFCGMNGDASWGNMFYYWGKGNHSTTDVIRNSTWGEESDMDNYLGLMKTKFIDKGILFLVGSPHQRFAYIAFEPLPDQVESTLVDLLVTRPAARFARNVLASTGDNLTFRQVALGLADDLVRAFAGPANAPYGGV